MQYLVGLLLLIVVAIFGAPSPTADQQYRSQHYGRELAEGKDIPNIVNFGLSREHVDQPPVIFRQIQDQDVYGSYAWEYELENSIVAKEEGHLKNAGTQNETQVAQGSFSYVGPDGVMYTVTYIADENGFQARGVHLPTPPPMPVELEQAYAKVRARPGYREDEGE